MSDIWGGPWSDGPNAPKIPSWLYLSEKGTFAGTVIGAILHGVVIALFFQCMGALLNPVNKIKGGIRWGLVAHTVAMFLFFMISTVIFFDGVSTAYIDERSFPGTPDLPPGPLEVGYLSSSSPVSALQEAMIPVNQWLADGLLLYRCYVIYSMNYWVMILPCLLYFASIAMGVVYIYQDSRPWDGNLTSPNFATAYFSIFLALNVLLTLLVVARLVLHSQNVRKAMGFSNGVTGFYTAIITMLVESYALYAAVILSFIVSQALNSPVVLISSKIFGSVQVIAPYLVIIRVANRRALTSKMVSGVKGIDSIQFRSQGTTDCSGTFLDEDLVSSVATNDEAPGKRGVWGETATTGVPL